MQVTPHGHALKIPFRLQAAAGRMLERFVYAYVVFSERVSLIDCGVAGSGSLLIDYLRQAGREPGDVATVFLTHAHPADTPWVEDVDKQNRERTVFNFADLVEGGVKVDTFLRDGERIDLGDGSTLEVRHTPGHPAGHLCFLYPREGVLFCGEAASGGKPRSTCGRSTGWLPSS